MIGTPERPWINTDPYLDIDGLKALEPDIITGICTSIEHHSLTLYGENVLYHPNFFTVRKRLHNLPDDDSVKATYLRVVEATKNMPKFWQTEAIKLYTKLCHEVYSGGPFILLRRESNYLLKNHESCCMDTPIVEHFPSLMRFIRERLPFTEIGRVLIFLNDHNLGTPIHTDGYPEEVHKHEFLWMSTNGVKPFFIYDPDTHEKHYVTSNSAFFNEQCWHGSDAVPTMNYSIRVDGIFTQEFREQIGIANLETYGG